MAISLHWDPDRRLLVIEMRGSPDDQELLAFSQGLAGNPEYPSPRRELVDLRGVEAADVSSDTLRRIAGAFGAADQTPEQSRIAVVAPANLPYGLSRMYQAFRSESPLPFQVFRDYDEALAWLKSDAPV